MSVLHVGVISVFFACTLSFTWALLSFFRALEKPPLGLRLIQITGLIFTLLHAWFLCRPGQVEGIFGLMGLGVYGVSFVLFWSAIRANYQNPLSLAFNTDQPQHLTSHGPYRCVRHPFYSSYLLSWSAGVVASKQLLLFPTLAIMLAIYYVAATMEERKFFDSPLASDYQRYRTHTGMFWPRLCFKNSRKQSIDETFLG